MGLILELKYFMLALILIYYFYGIQGHGEKRCFEVNMSSYVKLF